MRETDKVLGRLKLGKYASVDVSQTKEKGVAVCLLTVTEKQPITIRYYHQPFLSSKTSRNEVERMVEVWPEELRSANCYSVDSPLWYARQKGGRRIDQRSVWKELGFGDYLKNDPQQAPTEDEAQDKEKRWIAIGMWFAAIIQGFKGQVFEVYPTASFNALHLWQASGIPVTNWFANEPDEYTLIAENGSVQLSLRFLERLRAASNYGGVRTRFRKLSIWPYPDLWDAFGGAVTSILYCSQLTENVEKENARDEGRIVVPMRLATLRSQGLLRQADKSAVGARKAKSQVRSKSNGHHP
jgi:hypothetical protein